MILVGFGAGVGWLWRSELWLSLNCCRTGCDGWINIYMMEMIRGKGKSEMRCDDGCEDCEYFRNRRRPLF